ncbi:hypothetical protein TGRUB_214130 [Toxoplasma gondii RUB]|uniref:Uncharacterized protein n=1 Tax=Toxoplasma gondii RUB TaxID=935652 RepID=A0A086M093_TOXGO|nr:hypothetical protein TGRUB_214130 [Toxoplasma gondii RUB]
MAKTRRCGGKTPEHEVSIHPKRQTESLNRTKRTRDSEKASHRHKSASYCSSTSFPTSPSCSSCTSSSSSSSSSSNSSSSSSCSSSSSSSSYSFSSSSSSLSFSLSSSLSSLSSSCDSPVPASLSPLEPRRSPRLARSRPSPSSPLCSASPLSAACSASCLSPRSPVASSPHSSVSASPAKASGASSAPRAAPASARRSRRERKSEMAERQEEEVKEIDTNEPKKDSHKDKEGRGEDKNKGTRKADKNKGEEREDENAGVEREHERRRLEEEEEGGTLEQASKRLRLRCSLSSSEDSACVSRRTATDLPQSFPGSAVMAKREETKETPRRHQAAEGCAATAPPTGDRERRRRMKKVEDGGEEGARGREKQTEKEEAVGERNSHAHKDREKNMREEPTEKDAKPIAERAPEKHRKDAASKSIAAEKAIHSRGHASLLKTERHTIVASSVRLSPPPSHSSSPRSVSSPSSSSSTASSSPSPPRSASPSPSSPRSASPSPSLRSAPCASSSSASSSLASSSPSSSSAVSLRPNESPPVREGRGQDRAVSSSPASTVVSTRERYPGALLQNLRALQKSLLATKNQLLQKLQAKTNSTLALPSPPSSCASALLPPFNAHSSTGLSHSLSPLSQFSAINRSRLAARRVRLSPPSSVSPVKRQGLVGSGETEDAASVRGAAGTRSQRPASTALGYKRESPTAAVSPASGDATSAEQSRASRAEIPRDRRSASRLKRAARSGRSEKRDNHHLESLCQKPGAAVIDVEELESEAELQKHEKRPSATHAHVDFPGSSSSSCSPRLSTTPATTPLAPGGLLSSSSSSSSSSSLSSLESYAPERRLKSLPSPHSSSVRLACSPSHSSSVSASRAASSQPPSSASLHVDASLLHPAGALGPVSVSSPSLSPAKVLAGSSPASSPYLCMQQEPRIRFSLKKPAGSPLSVSAEHHRRREALEREAEEGEIIELSPPSRKISAVSCTPLGARTLPRGEGHGVPAKSKREKRGDAASSQQHGERDRERNGQCKPARGIQRALGETQLFHRPEEGTRSGEHPRSEGEWRHREQSPRHVLVNREDLTRVERERTTQVAAQNSLRGLSARLHGDIQSAFSPGSGASPSHLRRALPASADEASEAGISPFSLPPQRTAQSDSSPFQDVSVSSSPSRLSSTFASASPLTPQSLSTASVPGYTRAFKPHRSPSRREERGEGAAARREPSQEAEGNNLESGENGERGDRSSFVETAPFPGDGRAHHSGALEAERFRKEVGRMPCGDGDVRKNAESGEVSSLCAFSGEAESTLTMILTSLYAAFVSAATRARIDLSVLFTAFDEAFMRPRRRERRREKVRASSTLSPRSSSSSVSPERRSRSKRKSREYRSSFLRDRTTFKTKRSSQEKGNSARRSSGRERGTRVPRRGESGDKGRREKQAGKERGQDLNDSSTSEEQDEGENVSYSWHVASVGCGTKARERGENAKRGRGERRTVERNGDVDSEEKERREKLDSLPRNAGDVEGSSSEHQETDNELRISNRERGRKRGREGSPPRRGDRGEETRKETTDRKTSLEEQENERAQERVGETEEKIDAKNECEADGFQVRKDWEETLNSGDFYSHLGGEGYLLGFQMEASARKNGMSFIEKLRALKRFKGKPLLGK